jgi:predicted secreted protein
VTERRIGPKDAGRTVELAAGDRLVLALPENAGTGYTWEIEELPPSARVVEERFEPPANAGIGGASEHLFVLEAPQGGSFRLRHWRSWEGEQGVLERYEVTAAVRP